MASASGDGRGGLASTGSSIISTASSPTASETCWTMAGSNAAASAATARARRPDEHDRDPGAEIGALLDRPHVHGHERAQAHGRPARPPHERAQPAGHGREQHVVEGAVEARPDPSQIRHVAYEGPEMAVGG